VLVVQFRWAGAVRLGKVDLARRVLLPVLRINTRVFPRRVVKLRVGHLRVQGQVHKGDRILSRSRVLVVSADWDQQDKDKDYRLNMVDRRLGEGTLFLIRVLNHSSRNNRTHTSRGLRLLTIILCLFGRLERGALVPVPQGLAVVRVVPLVVGLLHLLKLRLPRRLLRRPLLLRRLRRNLVRLRSRKWVSLVPHSKRMIALSCSRVPLSFGLSFRFFVAVFLSTFQVLKARYLCCFS